jgi:hypothetical protein
LPAWPGPAAPSASLAERALVLCCPQVLAAVASLHWCTARLRACLSGWRAQAARLAGERRLAQAACARWRGLLLGRALRAWSTQLLEGQRLEGLLWASAQRLVRSRRLRVLQGALLAWQRQGLRLGRKRQQREAAEQRHQAALLARALSAWQRLLGRRRAQRRAEAAAFQHRSLRVTRRAAPTPAAPAGPLAAHPACLSSTPGRGPGRRKPILRG